MGTENIDSELSTPYKALKSATRAREMTEQVIKDYSGKNKKRWRIVTFLGQKGQEGNRIIDMLAIRKNTKDDCDHLEIILIDIKGSVKKAKKVKPEGILRLVEVAEYHHATNIIHAEIQKNKKGEDEISFFELDPSWKKADSKLQWNPRQLCEIF